MKKQFFQMLTASAVLFFFTTTLSAQEAKKHENPQWYMMTSVDYHSGKTSKAREIIENYYQKVAEKAGTPTPAAAYSLETGTYDYIYVWKMQDGVESLNWDISPNNVKWMKALAEVAGGKEKAAEIRKEYAACVREAKSELMRMVK